MMKWNVKEVAEAKGFKNAKELADKAMIPYASMYRIWNGTAEMIGLSTMEKLCNTLQVQPGMLIMWIDADGLLGSESPRGSSTKADRASTAKKSSDRSSKRAGRPGAGQRV